MKKILTLLAFAGLLFVSCSKDNTPPVAGPTPPEPVNYTAGSADFSKYVSLGNSLTAGYSDASLFMDGQLASYPNMMATSFALAGGGAFNMPLIADNLGGLTLGGQPLPGFGNRLYLSFATGSPLPIPKEGSGATEVSNILSGPFNNMGVPGAKSFHMGAPGYGNVQALAIQAANPYFVRMASAPNATVIGDALAQSPTFFSLWIGNNDLLSYATSGGVGVNQAGNFDPSTYGGNDITDPMVFAGVYNGLLQGLTAGGAKGIVANLPDVTKIPYFTTVPFAPLDPTNPAFGPQIATLNANFGQLNAVFAFLGVPERSITFSASAASALVIKDESLVDLSAQIQQVLLANGADAGTAAVTAFLYGQARQANANDLIVLPARNAIAKLNEAAFATLQTLGLPPANAGQLAINGITYPMEDKWVLTPDEQTQVTTATAQFNATIEALATQYNLGFFDAEAFYSTIAQTGVVLSDGSKITAKYGTGGGFSLDGVHPSPRGYALLANEFIKVIQTKYGAVLPAVNPLDYTGLYID